MFPSLGMSSVLEKMISGANMLIQDLQNPGLLQADYQANKVKAVQGPLSWFWGRVRILSPFLPALSAYQAACSFCSRFHSAAFTGFGIS